MGQVKHVVVYNDTKLFLKVKKPEIFLKNNDTQPFIHSTTVWGLKKIKFEYFKLVFVFCTNYNFAKTCWSVPVFWSRDYTDRNYS